MERLALRNPHSLALVLLLVLLLAAVPASAVTFSFASDDNHDGPTFQGNSGGSMPDDINDAASFSLDAAVNVDLMVDLNDDAAGGIVIFPATLTFAGSLTNYGFTARGSNYVHQWDVEDGAFTFRHAGTGQVLLTILYENALLTTWSPSLGNVGQTATLQGSERVDPRIRFLTGVMLQGIGVNDGEVALMEDFAFTLTHLRRPGTSALPFIHHGVFLNDWVSEGSFSAYATAGFVDIEPTGFE